MKYFKSDPSSVPSLLACIMLSALYLRTAGTDVLLMKSHLKKFSENAAVEKLFTSNLYIP